MDDIKTMIDDAMAEQLRDLREKHLNHARPGEFTVTEYQERLEIEGRRRAEYELDCLAREGAVILRKAGKFKYYSLPSDPDPLDDVL